MDFAQEYNLYEEVIRGAAYWQVEVYSYRRDKSSFIWETSRGNKAVKKWERGDFTEAREMAIALAKTNLIKVTLPQKGADGEYLFDNNLYLVDEPQGRPLDLENLLDLERIAKFLGKLHKMALYENNKNILSIHIMPNSFYVGRYGELLLWGFEDLRIENPLLSLAHLLYDLRNEDMREFVLKNYEEINPIEKRDLAHADKLIWDSAILLGNRGPKKIESQNHLEKLQELVGLLAPLLDQKYINVPVTEYMPSSIAEPLTHVKMSDLSNVVLSEYTDTIPTSAMVPSYEEDQIEISDNLGQHPVDSEVEVNEELDDILFEQENDNGQETLEEMNENEKPTSSFVKEKSEPISWKPFPKLPNRRW